MEHGIHRSLQGTNHLAPIRNPAFKRGHSILESREFRQRKTRLRQLGAHLADLLGIVRRHRKRVEPPQQAQPILLLGRFHFVEPLL